MSKHPLDDIQQDALDEAKPLASVLRRVVALGGQVGSQQLRRWASAELNGYSGTDEVDLPPYRLVPARLLMDGFRYLNPVNGQPVPLGALPREVSEVLDRPLRFSQPINEIAEIVERGRSDGFIHMSVVGGEQLIQLLNNEMGYHGQDFAEQGVVRVYNEIPVSKLAAVLDIVRTKLVELVAEMRDSLPSGQSLPTSAAADRAVGVVVGDVGRGATVNIQMSDQISGDVVSSIATPTTKPERWWHSTTVNVVGAFLGGLLLAAALWGLKELVGNDGSSSPTSTTVAPSSTTSPP